MLERELEQRAKINACCTSEVRQNGHTNEYDEDDDHTDYDKANNKHKYNHVDKPNLNDNREEEEEKEWFMKVESLHYPPMLTILISDHNKLDIKDDDHKKSYDNSKHDNDNDRKEEKKNCPVDKYPRCYSTDAVHRASTPTPEISVKKSYLYKNHILAMISSENKMVYLLLDKETSPNLITKHMADRLNLQINLTNHKAAQTDMVTDQEY